MRLAGLIAAGLVAAALVVGVVLIGIAALSDPGPETCKHFDDDIELALSNPPKPDDRDDVEALPLGSCEIRARKKLEVNLPGFDRSAEHDIRGAYDASPIPQAERSLRAARRAFVKGRLDQVIDAPELGQGAFVVIRPSADPTAPTNPMASSLYAVTGAEVELEPGVGFDADAPITPTVAPPSPPQPYLVAAHWRRGETRVTAGATRVGADPAEVRRATIRLAQLLDRRLRAGTAGG